MIAIRPFDPMRRGERGFVCQTWFRSYGNKRAGVSPEVYLREQSDLIDRIMSHAKIMVACSGEDMGTLHGWACAEPAIRLHYAFVTPDLHRIGLGKRLVAAAFGEYPQKADCTHRPPVFWERRFRFNFYPLTRLEAAA
jgi:GNAT superfamily N-acetyltransferase